MASGGRADDADAGRITSIPAGPGADRPQRARRVLDHDRVPVAGRSEAVLQHVSGNALRGQPLGVAFALVLRQRAISSAGKNEETCTVGLALLWQIGGEGRNILLLRAERAGSAIGPEGQGFSKQAGDDATHVVATRDGRFMRASNISSRKILNLSKLLAR